MSVPQSILRRWPLSLSAVPLLSIVLVGCEESMPTRTASLAPEVLSIQLVGDVFAESPTVETRVLARVDDPQGPEDLASVRLTVSDAAGQSLLSIDMLDDGTSGDILPRDGLFTAALSSAFAGGQVGSFLLSVRAEDVEGHASSSRVDTIKVLAGKADLPPILGSLTAPSVVYIDSTYEFLLTASVPERPENLDVAAVEYSRYDPRSPVASESGALVDDGSQGDVTARDGVFSRNFPSVLGAVAGVYTFRVEAVTADSVHSLPLVAYVRLVDRTANGPPRVSNVQAPQSISRSAQPNLYTLTVDVSDPEGLGDVSRVFFNSYLPDGSAAQNNPFLMRDDGQDNDAVAGDGRYSLTIQIDNSAQLGEFVFEFQAEDNTGNLSNKIVHVLTVTP